MEEERNIPLGSIINSLINQYPIKFGEDKRGDKKAIKMLVRRFCEKQYGLSGEDSQNLWERSTIYEQKKTGGQKEHQSHLFTEEETDFLLNAEKLAWSIIKTKVPPEQQEEAWAGWQERSGDRTEAARILEEQRRYLEEYDPDEDLSDEDDGFAVTEEELRAKKMEIMLEALFLRFFTPIDETLLKDDMLEMRYAPFTGITEETVKAERRLKTRKGYYYHERTEDEQPKA